MRLFRVNNCHYKDMKYNNSLYYKYEYTYIHIHIELNSLYQIY